MKHTFFFVFLIFPILLFSQQDFLGNVVHDGNQVYLNRITPVTQKGATCQVYSTYMILSYYKETIPISRLKSGKDSYYTNYHVDKKLYEIGYIYKFSRQKDYKKFSNIVKYSIDNGFPLLWSVDMAKSPIKQERKGGGGHMRLITGYEIVNEQLVSILYSDPWGSKHINKTMKMPYALRMTTLYGPVYPKNIKPEIAAELAELTKPPKVQRRDPFAP